MDAMQTTTSSGNHESLLDLFEMDDIDPIDIFKDITKPSRLFSTGPDTSTPDTQEHEHTQLRRESGSTLEEELLMIPGIATSSNSSMLETNKSENEMLVSTPRIEDLCTGLGPVGKTSKGNKKTKAQKNMKEPKAEIQSTHNTDDTSIDQQSDEMVVEPVLNFFVPTSTDNGSEAKLERKEIILKSTNSTVSKRNSLSGGSRSSHETMEETSLTAVENLQCFTENGIEATDGLIPIHKACAHFASDAAFIPVPYSIRKS